MSKNCLGLEQKNWRGDFMIKVVDSPMGYGKTSWCIDYMNKSPKEQKFIYITPFLDECKRVETSCKERKFTQPKINYKRPTKLDSLKDLISRDKNITSTHALFQSADSVLIELIKSHNYTLVLDEVMNVVQAVHNIKKQDVENLFELDLIEISDKEYNKVIWKDPNYNGRYNDVKDLANSETLYYVNNVLLVWAMPVEAFKCFDEIYILTYQFDCQIQKYYYDYFGIEYDYYHVINRDNEYKIVSTEDSNYDLEFRRKAKELINILDNEKLNAIGESRTALSKNWYNHAEDVQIKQLKNNCRNYFVNICGSPSKDNMWTTFKECQNKIKGNGFSKGFVSLNARSTNEFKDKVCLCYTVNRYLNPFYKAFFDNRNIKIDEDKYALSELLQWIWRSQIRDGKPINLYIPSKRMRSLLQMFLEE